MALFSDSKVKNVRLRKIPIIVVAILNTDPSAAPLSFLSLIKDKKDYIQKKIISNYLKISL